MYRMSDGKGLITNTPPWPSAHLPTATHQHHQHRYTLGYTGTWLNDQMNSKFMQRDYSRTPTHSINSKRFLPRLRGCFRQSARVTDLPTLAHLPHVSHASGHFLTAVLAATTTYDKRDHSIRTCLLLVDHIGPAVIPGSDSSAHCELSPRMHVASAVAAALRERN